MTFGLPSHVYGLIKSEVFKEARLLVPIAAGLLQEKGVEFCMVDGDCKPPYSHVVHPPATPRLRVDGLSVFIKSSAVIQNPSGDQFQEVVAAWERVIEDLG